MAEEKQFARQLREELTAAEGSPKHCAMAELSAIASYEGGGFDGERLILVSSENEALTRKVFTLLKKAFNIIVEISMYTKRRSGRTTYEISVTDPAVIKVLVKALAKPDISRICCRRAYMRGAFLSVGTITDPEKAYRMEFVLKTGKDAEMILNVLRGLGLEPKETERGKNRVIYLQDADQIRDAIALMDAPYAVLELENIRVLRNMRGMVGRRVNCETSNLNRTVKASAKQIRDIRYLEECGELANLPAHVQEAARIRVMYPDASLNELGEYMEPPCGKSGVNHRMRRISEYAAEIRHRKGN